jgi:hypothetical protein
MAPSNFSANKMMNDVRFIVGHGSRRVGSPGDRALELDLADRLHSYGFENVRLEPMNVKVWNEGKASLQVFDRTGQLILSPDIEPIPYCAFTPESGVSAELIFANSTADLDECRGKIVVAEIGFPDLNTDLLLRIAIDKHDPDDTLKKVNHPATWVRLGWHLYREAARRGAVGFIGILKDQPGGTCRMHGPYGFRETNILDKPIPGAWVGREQGAKLREKAQSHVIIGNFVLTGELTDGVTNNVVAELPGHLRDDEIVVLSCHHDSPYESPVEDATGCAVVLALAEQLAKERNLRRRLVVLFSAGHFYGSIGTRTFIEQHRKDITARTALEISIEHVALEAIENADGKLVASGYPEPTAMFVSFSEAIARTLCCSAAKAGLDRTILLPAEGPLGNYPPTDGGDWFEAGVPVINCISNPVYLLTNEDSLDWIDEQRLPRVADTFYSVLHELDGVSRKDLASTKSWTFRLFMKALRLLTSAVATRLWTRRIY